MQSAYRAQPRQFVFVMSIWVGTGVNSCASGRDLALIHTPRQLLPFAPFGRLNRVSQGLDARCTQPTMTYTDTRLGSRAVRTAAATDPHEQQQKVRAA